MKRERVYKSRVPLSILIEEFRKEGGIVESVPQGAIVKAPWGGYVVLFTPSDEEGVLYCFHYEQEKEKLIKFAQRVFARANLTMRNILAQEQVPEPEQKEEIKKDTSEVSERVLGTSDSVHGGDSVSGEVPETELGEGQDNSSSKKPALSQEETGSGQEEETAPSQPHHLSPDGGSSSCAGEDEGRESCLTDSSSSEASSSFGDEEGAGESCASDSSEPKRASEEAGSSEDGACLKSSECSALSQDEGGGDASASGQALAEEGTGSHAPDLSETPLEDILSDILSEDVAQEGKGSGESSTLPSPGGAYEGEASEPEREVSPSLSFKELRKIMSRGFTTTPSAHSNNSFGGVFGKLELIKDPPSQSLVNRARRVFARLVSSYGEGVEGPRWDRKKISTRIASYQNWKVSDRRKEIGRPSIAVFSDVSGSMDFFAKEVLKLSKILMRIGVSGCEVICITHSNGYPLELWVNGRKVEEVDRDNWYVGDYVIDWYKRVFARFNVRVVVLAADWDGSWLYKRLAEEFSLDKIYWLDVNAYDSVANVTSIKGPVLVKFPPVWSRFEWSSEASRKIEYVCNCQDAEDFVRGLELMIAKKETCKTTLL